MSIYDILRKSQMKEDFQKARTHKYFKREMKGGKWKYYYTEAEYKKERGGGKKEKKSKVSQSDVDRMKGVIGKHIELFDGKLSGIHTHPSHMTSWMRSAKKKFPDYNDVQIKAVIMAKLEQNTKEINKESEVYLKESKTPKHMMKELIKRDSAIDWAEDNLVGGELNSELNAIDNDTEITLKNLKSAAKGNKEASTLVTSLIDSWNESGAIDRKIIKKIRKVL